MGTEQAAVQPGLSGEDFVRWCTAEWKDYAKASRIIQMLSMEPVRLDAQGLAIIKANIPKDLCNPMGIVHGGIISTLLDETGGIAVCSLVHLVNLRSTIESKITYFSRMQAGELFAHAHVIGKSANILFVEAFVRTPEGAVAARVTASYLVSRECDVGFPKSKLGGMYDSADLSVAPV